VHAAKGATQCYCTHKPKNFMSTVIKKKMSTVTFVMCNVNNFQ